jgi:hypothetical protein
MVQPVLIEPEAVYDDGVVLMVLGLPTATLSRARREGRLRYTRQGNRILYLGQWLLDWLQGDARSGPTRAESS